MFKRILVFALVPLFHLLIMPAGAETVNEGPTASGAVKSEVAAGKGARPEKLSTTHHSMEVGGKKLQYAATAGRLAIRGESGKPEAEIFFIAYVKEQEGEGTNRPLTFAFNGGPGASSVWLNFGAFGPKRVLLPKDNEPLPPPYGLVDNEYTLLDLTDLVFIDPVGTGYSRAAEGVEPKKFYSVQGDLDSIGKFIREYASRFERWNSPKFIAGESYGTFRAVLLAERLQRRYGLYVNGLVLISSALNFQAFVFNSGNHLPYVMFLPSYAAAAFYHKKLAPELQVDFQKTLEEVQQWAISKYIGALMKGDALSESERSQVVERLAAYTGLPQKYLKKKNLKITSSEFAKELLKKEGLNVGILDSRLKSVYQPKETFFDEPDMLLTIGPYVAAMSAYLKSDLKYETDLIYHYFSQEANQAWNWGSAIGGYPSATDTLGDLISKLLYFKVFIARGYYDLDVPYYATTYNLYGLWLKPEMKRNVTIRHYESGHQIYTRESSLKALWADVSHFVKESCRQDSGAAAPSP